MRNSRLGLVTIATLFLFTFTACPRDFPGTRLFTINYPITELTLRAGSPGGFNLVGNVPTGIMQAMRDNNVTANDIDLIGGFAARLTSLSGEDFGQYSRMEIRVCPVGQSGGCNQSDIVFSKPDLFRRRDQIIQFDPSLLNARELFLSEDVVRVELSFVVGELTSQNIETRLEWSMQAVGDLD